MFYLFFMPCSVEICSMFNIHCHCHHKRSIVSVIYAAWFVSCLTSTNQTHFRSRSIYRIYRITSVSWCNIHDCFMFRLHNNIYYFILFYFWKINPIAVWWQHSQIFCLSSVFDVTPLQNGFDVNGIKIIPYILLDDIKIFPRIDCCELALHSNNRLPLFGSNDLGEWSKINIRRDMCLISASSLPKTVQS